MAYRGINTPNNLVRFRWYVYTYTYLLRVAFARADDQEFVPATHERHNLCRRNSHDPRSSARSECGHACWNPRLGVHPQVQSTRQGVSRSHAQIAHAGGIRKQPQRRGATYMAITCVRKQITDAGASLVDHLRQRWWGNFAERTHLAHHTHTPRSSSPNTMRVPIFFVVSQLTQPNMPREAGTLFIHNLVEQTLYGFGLPGNPIPIFEDCLKTSLDWLRHGGLCETTEYI